MPARCTWTFRGCRPLATRRSAAWRRRTATCSAATSRASTSCPPCRLVTATWALDARGGSSSYRKNIFRRRESLPDRELCLCAKKRSRRTTRGGSLCHVGARLEVYVSAARAAYRWSAVPLREKTPARSDESSWKNLSRQREPSTHRALCLRAKKTLAPHDFSERSKLKVWLAPKLGLKVVKNSGFEVPTQEIGMAKLRNEVLSCIITLELQRKPSTKLLSRFQTRGCVAQSRVSSSQTCALGV